MPIIILNDGNRKRVKYGDAARLNEFLSDPDKLNSIRCSACHVTADDPDKPQCEKCKAERDEKETFMMTVQSIDWTDVDRKRSSTNTGRQSLIRAENPELKRVLADKTLTGKAKFDAVRRAMTGKSSDGEEKFDEIP